MSIATPSIQGRRIRLVLIFGMLAFFSAALNAYAFWGSTDNSNPAAAMADLLPVGSTPTASATAATTVEVDFTRGSTRSGREVTSYVIKRYDSPSSTGESASFTCAWPSSTALDCEDTGVADGTWYYAVTPHIAGSSWHGVEGGRSAGVIIDTTAPNPPSTPNLAAGSDSGSSDSDNLTNVTTPVFTGTAEAGATVRMYAGAAEMGSGTATGGSYSIQVGALAEGTHQITARATDPAGNTSGPSSALSVTIDTTAPAITRSVIDKQETGYLVGALKQAGGYYIYANVTDAGGGAPTVTANVGGITTGATSVVLTAGSYSAEGMVYNYRSGPQAATSLLTGGNSLAAFSITSTDTAGNAHTESSFNVSIDNTRPAITDIQTYNGTGSGGRADTGDTIVYTFSERIDPHSIISGWDGSSTNVVVQLQDGGCLLSLLVRICSDDGFTIRNGANSAALPLGSVDLNRSDYIGGVIIGGVSPINFGTSGAPSTMVQSGATITITLGSGGSGDGGSGGAQMQLSEVGALFDAAANSLSNSGISEQSPSGDREF